MIVICHSDDRWEEESRKHIVDVYEILRRYTPQNDMDVYLLDFTYKVNAWL